MTELNLVNKTLEFITIYEDNAKFSNASKFNSEFIFNYDFKRTFNYTEKRNSKFINVIQIKGKF